MTFGRITAILGGIFLVFVGLILAFPHVPWILPVAAAEEATGIDNLFLLMLVVSLGIFIFVQGFLLYFVWLYRQRPEDDPDAVGRALHGDNRLEIAWTIAPAIFLVVLTILSLRVFNDLNLSEDMPPPGAHIVDVTSQQFFWTFGYPATGISEVGTLTMEKGTTHVLNITARDVNHAFWVPQFRIKQDATPGFVRSIQITPDMTHEEAGFPEGFPLRCAEFCGAGHPTMLATVHVLEPDAYQAWEAEQLAGMEAVPAEDASPEELVEFGLQVYVANGCTACHELEAAGSTAAVGPTHNGLGVIAEERIEDPGYTGEAETPAEYIAESIRNPGAYVVPGYQNIMPPYSEEQISDDELNALVQMLLQQ
ncbi:MAG: cytochrome c oxidase subunit II [Chloroflexota bacterium]|nr:cytochrome c oxidase subunit II [Chloroflexota bacterium]